MKAKLEFNLPEDQQEFEYAQHGMAYYSALDEIRKELRRLAKYDDRDTVPVSEVLKIFREATEGIEF